MRAAQELHEGKTVGQAELDAVLLEAEEINQRFPDTFCLETSPSKNPYPSAIVNDRFFPTELAVQGPQEALVSQQRSPRSLQRVFRGIAEPAVPPAAALSLAS